MRRVAVFWMSGILALLGFGSAYVMAASGSSRSSDGVTICHSGSGKLFVEITPADVGALDGHVKNDQFDIIPPFAVIKNGTTVTFSGQNMNTIYGAGFTGAEVLANHCAIPRGGEGITETVATTTSTPVDVTVTTPATTMTVPGETTTAISTATITVPEETTTAPETTTIVTVPPNATATVTVPTRTVTLPAVTVTTAGQTIERPAETVTLPGTTATVTAAATTTVVTVTGPNQIVHPGLVANKRIKVTITTPKRVIRVSGHVYRLHGKGKVAGKSVVVVLIRGCPRGTVHDGNGCGAPGKG
jgi:hypothetical protein